MPTTYTVCEDTVTDLLASAVKSTHPHLKEAGVTFACLFAHADPESGSAALKHHGYPAAALIKLNPLKQRVEGLSDCTIYLDAAAWEEKTEEERTALLDHEITHCELIFDKDGKLKRDDAGRPRIKLRKHDFELGGFFDVVERHKTSAPESQSYIDLHRKMSQMTFPWG